MRRDSLKGKGGAQKPGKGQLYAEIEILVRKYQRILPRPSEAHGQPLSIMSKNAATGISMTIASDLC
jgi:hypothetical protein